MMKLQDKKRLDLLDQYDDAAFALLMDEYAEEEGARLRKEFEEAKAAGEVCETPNSLDEKCLRLIRRHSRKKRAARMISNSMKSVCKAAVIAMVILGVFSGLVLSVDALRVPVLNYLVSHTEILSLIQFDEPDRTEQAVDSVDDLMPDGYSKVYSEVVDGLPSIMYTNNLGGTVLFDATRTEGTYIFDSEDAIVKEIAFLDFPAVYISKDSRLQLLWFDEDALVTMSCVAEGLEEDDFFSLCTNLANKYKDIGG